MPAPEGSRVILTFDTYCAHVFELLELPVPTELSEDSNLGEDLGIDSLQALELVVISEQLAGWTEPCASVPAISTMQDAYGYYRSRLAADQ